MHRSRLTAIAAPMITGCAIMLSACTTDSGGPLVPRDGSAFDLVAVTEDVVLPAVEFDFADEDRNGKACVKQTPSTHVVYKDDNEATPTQPCPPSFQSTVKGATLKMNKLWLSEDENGNRVVCVKFLGNDKEIVKDDNVSTPSQPCPPAYNVAGATKQGTPTIPLDDLKATDDNYNSVVCMMTWETTKNFSLRDDNTATPSQPCPPAFLVVTTGETKETATEAETTKP
jgi:hypothetical protein